MGTIVTKHQETLDRIYVHCNKVVDILRNGQWEGRRCFILAGGESLTDFDFNKLKGELVIAINKAFISYPKANINYFMDLTFYESVRSEQQDLIEEKKVKELWDSLKGVKVCLSPFSPYKFDKDVYCVRRCYSPEVSNDLNYGLYGGSCSAFGALGLALILGASQIYFLGLDLQMKEKTHFHKGYLKQNVSNMKVKLQTYKKQFELFSNKFKEKAEIINLGTENTTSLRCFPIQSVEEVLG